MRRIAPNEVPARDQELQNVKTEELIKKDASGHLRAHDKAKLPETRRGLASEVADVMSLTAHERLIDKMFQEYQREPLMGYISVTCRKWSRQRGGRGS